MIPNLKLEDIPKPISKRQHMYVTSKTDITLFGGSAGSGKSEVGVIDLLRYVMIQNFIAVITRRTTPQLKGAGGILSKCKRIFSSVYRYGEDYIWRDKEGKFIFYKRDEQGNKYQVSEVFLKHFEHEKDEDNWQGIEANLFLVDEATQFTQPMIQYITSRMRNPSCPEVEPCLKMTCNPDADHFLREWVEPYLNDDGTPDRNKDGLVRYFVFNEGTYCWGDTKAEVVEKYGCPEEDILSFQFISANVFDNPIVQKINPKYVAWLKGLQGVEKQRLLYGNWKVRQEASSYYDRKNTPELMEPPNYSMFTKIVRAYDFAGTLPHDGNRSPDYTASVKMGRLKTGDYVILEVNRTRIGFGHWDEFVWANAQRDGKKVEIVFPQDPNPMAKSDTIKRARALCDRGYVASVRRSGEGKLDSFRPFAAAAQLGVVSIVKNCGSDLWNEVFNTNDFFFLELETFTGLRKKGEAGHDDMVDCCSLAYAHLTSRFVLPSNFTKTMDLGNNIPSALLRVRQ